MNYAALRFLLKAQPFEPFQLVLSSGDKYPVRHPEMLMPLKDRVLVGLPLTKSDDDLPDSFVTISYLHIAAAEPISNSHSKPIKTRGKK